MHRKEQLQIHDYSCEPYSEPFAMKPRHPSVKHKQYEHFIKIIMGLSQQSNQHFKTTNRRKIISYQSSGRQVKNCIIPNYQLKEDFPKLQ